MFLDLELISRGYSPSCSCSSYFCSCWGDLFKKT